MGTIPKLVTILGLTGKVEASYNAGATLSTATDGIKLIELPKFSASYAYDGAAPPPPGISGYQRRRTPVGRTFSTSFKTEAKGAGAAYSASVTPQDVHTLLRIAGFDGAVTTGAGTEKWTYTPTPAATGFASGAFNAYARQQLYPLTGCYADLTITADGPNVPVWEFATQGLSATAISDIAVPAITYSALTVDAPKATSIAFTIGNATSLIVRKFTFKLGRQISPRLDINSGGHAGFAPGRRTPTLEVTFENTTLQGSPFTAASAIDPYQLYEAGTEVACTLTVGSAQYNKWSLTAGKAQIMAAPTDDEDGPTALVTLQLQLNPTALGNNDDVTFLFN